MEKEQYTDEELRKRLTPEEYRVLRERGTEMPFSGELHNAHEKGMYTCRVCGSPLFSSGAKFDSGTGWPSFDDPVAKENIKLVENTSNGMRRTEVTCARCGSHLGHVFDDGPTATGKRYCINSVCLALEKEQENKSHDESHQ